MKGWHERSEGRSQAHVEELQAYLLPASANRNWLSRTPAAHTLDEAQTVFISILIFMPAAASMWCWTAAIHVPVGKPTVRLYLSLDLRLRRRGCCNADACLLRSSLRALRALLLPVSHNGAKGSCIRQAHASQWYRRWQSHGLWRIASAPHLAILQPTGFALVVHDVGCRGRPQLGPSLICPSTLCNSAHRDKRVSVICIHDLGNLHSINIC